MDSLELISLKDYAEMQGCGLSPLYRKIKRNKEQLGEHIWKVGGKKMIDKYAQEFLKPSTVIIREQEKQIESLSGIVEKKKEQEEEQQDNYTKIKRLERDNETYIKQLNKYEAKIENLEEIIEQNNNYIEKLKDQLRETEKEIEELKAENEKLSKQIEEKRKKKIFGFR